MLETTLRTDGPYTFDGRPYLRIGNTTSRMPQAEYQRQAPGTGERPGTVRTGRWPRGTRSPTWTFRKWSGTLRTAVHQGRLESQPSDPVEGLDRLHLRVDGHCSARWWCCSDAS